MLKAAVDVYYSHAFAKAVCILFDQWNSRDVFSLHEKIIDEFKTYEPGSFYKRELPCILEVLQHVDPLMIDTIVVDGYVYLDDNGRKGLGAYLYDALEKKVPVIGVAKSRFHQNTKLVAEVRRGKSLNPLFVSAVGIELDKAAENIRAMAGDFRMPALLQYLDKKTKEEH